MHAIELIRIMCQPLVSKTFMVIVTLVCVFLGTWDTVLAVVDQTLSLSTVSYVHVLVMCQVALRVL